jgi:two-component system phosphate regulon response regulator PhoB
VPTRTILAVDDEEDILELVDYNLSKEGYDVVCVTSGEKALEAARTDKPNLILLDLMLPGLDGLDVCKRLKADPLTADIPIVILTAKGEETDIVLGLELGAEDYVTKPFNPKVLVARVRAVLRRGVKSGADVKAPIVVEDIVIHPGRNEVTVEGKPVQLTYTEYEILHYLARRPGWVFTRYQIVEAVRGDDYAVTDRVISPRRGTEWREISYAPEDFRTEG